MDATDALMLMFLTATSQRPTLRRFAGVGGYIPTILPHIGRFFELDRYGKNDLRPGRDSNPGRFGDPPALQAGTLPLCHPGMER